MLFVHVSPAGSFITPAWQPGFNAVGSQSIIYDGSCHT